MDLPWTRSRIRSRRAVGGRRRRRTEQALDQASALHHGEAAGAGDALRDGAVDVAAVRRVALVLAEARLLRPQRRAAPRRHRPAEQRARARAQRRRVARRRRRVVHRRRQQDDAQQRQRRRLLAHGRPRSPLGCFGWSGRRRVGMETALYAK